MNMKPEYRENTEKFNKGIMVIKKMIEEEYRNI